jgi:drug/metabolite transporter (DMT)-like permease
MNIPSQYRGIYGFFLAFLGAVLFSTKAVLVKLTYVHEVDPVIILSLRMIFSLPFYIVALLFISSQKGKGISLSMSQVAQLFVLGIAGYYFSSLMDFQGLKYISASLERLIIFIYPTLVVMLSALFYKKRIGKKEAISLFLTYSGIVFVIATDLQPQQNNLVLGSTMVFLSALTYAVYLIGSGRLIPHMGSLRFTTYVMIISSLAVLVHFFIQYDLSALVLPTEVYVLAILMAVFATVIPSFLLSEAIKIIGSEKTSIIASIGPVSTITLAFIYLGEIISIQQCIGAFFVLSGVMLIQGYDLLMAFLKRAYISLRKKSA